MEKKNRLVVVLSRNYSTGLSVVRSLGSAGYTVDLVASSYKAGNAEIVAEGADFDAFMEIDCPNNVVEYQGFPRNPSKYMLYADCFNDYLDYTVKPGGGETYKAYAAQLHATAKTSRRYGYVFDTAAKLCDVLTIKYELGLRTRQAYEADDKAALKQLAENEYVQVAKRIRVFAKAFEKQWMLDNKPHGFDVQDLRIGGLLYRLESCRRRLLEYVSGKVDSIPELEEKLLPYGKKEQSLSANIAPYYATVNLIHHSHQTDIG